jgi:hypothetical protein
MPPYYGAVRIDLCCGKSPVRSPASTKNIAVRVENTTLTVHGERKIEKEEKEENFGKLAGWISLILSRLVLDSSYLLSGRLCIFLVSNSW